MTEYRIRLDYPRPPLTANQRLHWARKASITQQVRVTTKILVRRAGVPPMARCEVYLYWYVNTSHRRDSDNVVPTLKAACDAIVDAGVVHDDTPYEMRKHMPIIVPGTRETTPVAYMELVIREIDPINARAAA